MPKQTIMLEHDENGLRRVLNLQADDDLPEEIHEAYAWMRAMLASGEITFAMLMTICVKADQLRLEKRVEAINDSDPLEGVGDFDEPDPLEESDPFRFAKGDKVECEYEGQTCNGEVVLHEASGQIVRVKLDDDTNSWRRIPASEVRSLDAVGAY